MKKIAYGKETIAAETTTLPEGARLSVSKIRTGRGTTYIELRADRAAKCVKMRVEDGIAVHNLPTYLKLVQREIERRRGMLSKPPEYPFRRVQNFHQFVNNMAFNRMFVFHDFSGASENI